MFLRLKLRGGDTHEFPLDGDSYEEAARKAQDWADKHGWIIAWMVLSTDQPQNLQELH